MNESYVAQQKKIIQQMKDNIRLGQIKQSIVEMRSNYENDNATGLVSVAFPPINITKIISEKIIEPLKSTDNNHFYYSTEFLHLTIKNVRTVNSPPLFNNEDVDKVDNLFAQIFPKFETFNFTLQGLVLFPTSVSLIGYCHETLKELVQTLDFGLKDIGVPDNKKYISDTIFFGNITLCRFTQNPNSSFKNKLQELENIYIGEMPVSEVSLITCNSVCNPKTRKIIATYKLRETPSF